MAVASEKTFWTVPVANKQDCLARLQTAIQHVHGCTASWIESVPVHEVFGGQTVWKGGVEVFDLAGHPKAKRCYGWSNPIGIWERFVTVLEIPPVKSAETAVRFFMLADG